MAVLYDSIGRDYAGLRRPDPSIDRAIQGALGDVTTLLNVGAGCGSYEPTDRDVVAVELSDVMIRQRAADAAPVVQADATSLPFATNAFDAAMAVLTVHHWPDRERGLREMRRVSRGAVVVMTWDADFPGFWLTDYFPQIMDIDRPIFPAFNEFEEALGPVEVVEVPIPHDCTDGFMCAYWRRPEAYLDPHARSAISTFAKLADIEQGLGRLRDDLDSGQWECRYGDVLAMNEMDLGYRLVVAA